MLGFLVFGMNFLPNVFINLADQLCFWRSTPAPGHSPSQPPAPSTIELGNNDASIAVEPEDRSIIQEDVQLQYPPDPTEYHMRMQWSLLVIGVCFEAVSSALQAFQISDQPLPVTFHWFCLALELAFLTLLVSMYVRHGYQVAAGILEHVGILFGSMAFLVAITMNLPKPFMRMSVVVYVISILIIIFANLLARTLKNTEPEMLGKFSVVVKFYFTLIELPKQLPLWRDRPVAADSATTQLEPSAAHDPEVQSMPVKVIQQQPDHDHHRLPIDQMMKMEWALLVVGACFAAVSVALQALQTPQPRSSIFPWFCMSLHLAFLALGVSIYIRRWYKKASLVMEHVAVFLGVTAFTLAIVMNLKTPFMEISIGLSLIALFIVIFANLFSPA